MCCATFDSAAAAAAAVVEGAPDAAHSWTFFTVKKSSPSLSSSPEGGARGRVGDRMTELKMNEIREL